MSIQSFIDKLHKSLSEELKSKGIQHPVDITYNYIHSESLKDFSGLRGYVKITDVVVTFPLTLYCGYKEDFDGFVLYENFEKITPEILLLMFCKKLILKDLVTELFKKINEQKNLSSR